MAARKKTAARKQTPARRSASRAPRDALALLRADHQTVQGLFDKFDKARGEDRKTSLARQICSELKVHTQIEEEIFYPAIRGAIRDKDLLDEATVEHQGAKDLIAQIESADAGDDLFDARVTVLGEYIKHHVKEEHNEMFPQVRKTKLDLRELGARLAERKEELKRSAGRKPAPSGGLSGSSSARARRAKNEEKPSAAESESILARMARGIGVGGT